MAAPKDASVVTDPDNPDVKLTQQSWDWFFDSLWAQPGDAKRRLKVDIADTVMMHDGAPVKWFFNSAKDGCICKKKPKNVNLALVTERFQEVALADPRNAPHNVMAVRTRVSGSLALKTKLLDENVTRTFLSRNGPFVQLDGAAVLQLYIHAQGGSGTVHRNEYAVSSGRRKIQQTTYKYYTRELPPDAQKESNSPRNAQVAEVTKTFQKCNHKALNEKLNESTRTLVRFVEARRHVRIHRVYCDYIVDHNDKVFFIQAVNIFVGPPLKLMKDEPHEPPVPIAGYDGRLLKGELPSRADPPEAIILRIAKGAHHDGRCHGDYCGFTLDSVQDGVRIRPQSPKDGETSPDGKMMYHISNKSIVLARFEKILKAPAEPEKVEAKNDPAAEVLRAAAGGEAGGSPSALSGEFRRIKPDDYYKEVAVCLNCYQIYNAMDQRRSRTLIEAEEKEKRERIRRAKERAPEQVRPRRPHTVATKVPERVQSPYSVNAVAKFMEFKTVPRREIKKRASEPQIDLHKVNVSSTASPYASPPVRRPSPIPRARSRPTSGVSLHDYSGPQAPRRSQSAGKPGSPQVLPPIASSDSVKSPMMEGHSDRGSVASGDSGAKPAAVKGAPSSGGPDAYFKGSPTGSQASIVRRARDNAQTKGKGKGPSRTGSPGKKGGAARPDGPPASASSSAKPPASGQAGDEADPGTPHSERWVPLEDDGRGSGSESGRSPGRKRPGTRGSQQRRSPGSSRSQSPQRRDADSQYSYGYDSQYGSPRPPAARGGGGGAGGARVSASDGKGGGSASGDSRRGGGGGGGRRGDRSGEYSPGAYSYSASPPASPSRR